MLTSDCLPSCQSLSLQSCQILCSTLWYATPDVDLSVYIRHVYHGWNIVWVSDVCCLFALYIGEYIVYIFIKRIWWSFSRSLSFPHNDDTFAGSPHQNSKWSVHDTSFFSSQCSDNVILTDKSSATQQHLSPVSTTRVDGDRFQLPVNTARVDG